MSPNNLCDGEVSAHDDAVEVLRRWIAPSTEQDSRRVDYLSHLALHPDALERSGPPAHLTASCLVLDANLERVLLAHHRKADAWFQMGGHLEPDDSGLRAAAWREAAEESGLDELTLTADPVDLDRHVLAGAFGRCREHLDVRFAAIAPRGAIPQVSSESFAVRWFPLERLPDSAEPGLRRLVSAAVATTSRPRR